MGRRALISFGCSVAIVGLHISRAKALWGRAPLPLAGETPRILVSLPSPSVTRAHRGPSLERALPHEARGGPRSSICQILSTVKTRVRPSQAINLSKSGP